MALKGAAQLLEVLSGLAGCCYLSDLRTPSYRERVAWALWQLDPDDYPLSQWREAAQYLLNRPWEFSTPRQARQEIAGVLNAPLLLSER